MFDASTKRHTSNGKRKFGQNQITSKPHTRARTHSFAQNVKTSRKVNNNCGLARPFEWCLCFALAELLRRCRGRCCCCCCLHSLRFCVASLGRHQQYWPDTGSHSHTKRTHTQPRPRPIKLISVSLATECSRCRSIACDAFHWRCHHITHKILLTSARFS